MAQAVRAAPLLECGILHCMCHGLTLWVGSGGQVSTPGSLLPLPLAWNPQQQKSPLPMLRDAGPARPPTHGLGKAIALDIARGLAFLHSQHIVHLDLKSPNGMPVPRMPCHCCASLPEQSGTRSLLLLVAASSSRTACHRMQTVDLYVVSYTEWRVKSCAFGCAVLLTAKNTAKVGDVGLARLMPNDYMSAQAALGTFSWTVHLFPCHVMQPLHARGDPACGLAMRHEHACLAAQLVMECTCRAQQEHQHQCTYARVSL